VRFDSTLESFDFGRIIDLTLANASGDILMILDADMTVEFKNFNKSKLNADAYYLQYLGDIDYSQVLLVNNKLDWQYMGVTHEYIASESAKQFEKLDSIKINHLYDGSNRLEKFDRDIKLLLKGIEQEPQNARYYFYLANSYRDIGNYEKAAEYYYKRVKMYGWEEEVFYSIYQLGICNEKIGNIKEAKYYYLQAWEFRPTRAESLYELARLCRERKEYHQAYMFAKKGLEIPYPTDILFIHKNIYTYLLNFEKNIASYWLTNYEHDN